MARAIAAILVLCLTSRAAAQTLPTGPVELADGRVTLAGDFAASYGSADPGFYNYTDYQYSALRRIRAGITGQATLGDRFAVLGEMRIEHSSAPQLFALYLRVRPWTSRTVDFQIGRLPPTFGTFARHAYGADNPLIGSPLGYQYLTSLRSDSVPANANELLRMRGRGWLSNFSVGSTTPHNGVPFVEAFRWDTGAQVHASSQWIDGTASVTIGTVSNPLKKDDNGRPQVAARVVARPVIGLVLGASAAGGPFVADSAAAAAGIDSRKLTQRAWGADAEYSLAHFLVRSEFIFSQWKMPAVAAPYIDRPLDATSALVEGRYKILPGLYAAARVDHLGFSDVTGTTGAREWDAPVTRVEVGGGYSIQRNLLLKGSFQLNRRETAFLGEANLVAMEVVFWF